MSELVGERYVADLFDGVDPATRSRLIASGNLLHGPAVAVRIAEEDERAPDEVLNLGDFHSPLEELRARGVYVRDDHLHTLDGAGLRLRDPRPYCDRAGRPGRRQLHEANLVADPVIVVGVEAGLFSVEGLRPVHVRDGYRHQFDLPIHDTPSFRMVAQHAPLRTSHF